MSIMISGIMSLIMTSQTAAQLGPKACRHTRSIYTEEKAKVVAAVWGTEFIQFLGALAILHQEDLKNRMNSSFSYIILVVFILFFMSSWCNSFFLHIILEQFSLLCISSWCYSFFSSYHPGAIHSFLHIILVQNI